MLVLFVSIWDIIIFFFVFLGSVVIDAYLYTVINTIINKWTSQNNVGINHIPNAHEIECIIILINLFVKFLSLISPICNKAITAQFSNISSNFCAPHIKVAWKIPENIPVNNKANI